LLDEGPFEWSGTGLNEGETISFEAPRKWRVIKQQMGHGAFYGMQIIVYGQLIAPSLVSLVCQSTYLPKSLVLKYFL
jgi:topoisomerase (DNA) II binding protein 1